MAKSYESMDLKEVFFAAKDRGIDLPQHFRDVLKTNNHPKNIEDARQHLLAQINAHDTRKLAKRAYILATLTFVLVLLLLAFSVFAYTHPRQAQPKVAQTKASFDLKVT